MTDVVSFPFNDCGTTLYMVPAAAEVCSLQLPYCLLLPEQRSPHHLHTFPCPNGATLLQDYKPQILLLELAPNASPTLLVQSARERSKAFCAQHLLRLGAQKIT